MMFDDTLEISIHAPTRGATEVDLTVEFNTEFQSTLPREERQDGLLEVISKVKVFQSTLPREERQEV